MISKVVGFYSHVDFECVDVEIWQASTASSKSDALSSEVAGSECREIPRGHEHISPKATYFQKPWADLYIFLEKVILQQVRKVDACEAAYENLAKPQTTAEIRSGPYSSISAPDRLVVHLLYAVCIQSNPPGTLGILSGLCCSLRTSWICVESLSSSLTSSIVFASFWSSIRSTPGRDDAFACT